jgi:hypothetical protein
MNELEKIMNEKKTENGDKAYKTTGNNLTDLLFMTPYFEKNLDQAKIGESEKEKIFSMYIRDPRYGLGRRDLGRKLMGLSKVDACNIIKAGRYDDLWHIPTNENLGLLKIALNDRSVDKELAKKWMPRLTGKDKKYAKALCKMWGISEKDYRALIKTDSTTEYKLSYAEKNEENSPLNELFKKNNYIHPLVDKINFEQVPSLAMTKYLHTFSTREDLKERFAEYMKAVKENKAKVNTKTANVYDAYKTATMDCWTPQGIEEDAREVVSKKIVDQETLGVEMNAIVILDTSGSMGWYKRNDNMPSDGSNLAKAMSLAYALSIKSTYAPNQLISFSSRPQLMTIKGSTMKEKYQSMYTGDCSNTDFGRVMDLLQSLKKYPEYLIVLSDMEFDVGSNMSKERTMKMFKERGAETKIIWWNLNDRNKTVPEFDEYGNIYISGYNIQMLKLLENKFDMSTYIDKILEDYRKKVGI